MSLTGHENHDIPLNEAAAMTRIYRDYHGPNAVIAHYFGKDAIQAILDQTDVVGIRIYYGISQGIKQLIIVGVDTNGTDIYEGLLADESLKCPPVCAPSNPLNSNV